MIYQTDHGTVFVVLRGDHEVNDIKLRELLKTRNLTPADKSVENALGTVMGFAGPIGIKNVAAIIIDNAVAYMKNFVVGANEQDFHLTNVNTCDFTGKYADIRFATPGDICKCGDKLQFSKAYELGHIFALGQHYTKMLNLTYINAQNKPELLTMGCYGIGVERTVAAIIEQNNDTNGIAWPPHVAPITVNVIDIGQPTIAKQVYETLVSHGFDVLWDDRTNVSPGVKFKDSDLVGIPYKIVVGKTAESGTFEFATRTGEKKFLTLKEIINEIKL
jgi:prolyl-tRNA synthetase